MSRGEGGESVRGGRGDRGPKRRGGKLVLRDVIIQVLWSIFYRRGLPVCAREEDRFHI